MERTAASAAWKTLMENGAPQTELTVMQRTQEAGVDCLTEGVIDAATLGANGWRVMDWKTDEVIGDAWDGRHVQYARQVDAYVRMLTSLTDRPAAGSVERVMP